jgi:hypothetical protein
MKTLENQIMYNLLMFQLTKQAIYRIDAVVLVEQLADKYHVKLRNMQPQPLEKIIPKFALNPDGYSVEKLSILVASIKNLK